MKQGVMKLEEVPGRSVFAAAVILDPNQEILGLNDSKN